MKILIIINNSVGMYNFRRELVEKLLDDGHEVCISSPYGEKNKYFKKIGAIFIETEINRHGINIVQEFKLFSAYLEIIRKINPGLVLTYTVKPNIYAGIACRINKSKYIANITGLGGPIQNGNCIFKKLLLLMYKIALKEAEVVFFQNKSNQEFMLSNNIVSRKSYLLPGSGVNLEQHKFEEYPKDDSYINLLFVGRLMRDKGFVEFVKAAIKIKNKYKNVKFTAIGFCEEEFKEELSKLEAGKYIDILGSQDDVIKFIKNSNAIILPSYHEGMSNVLLEASACGRPILASRIPGCIETFDEAISGFGFEPRNVNSLVSVIERFIALPYEEKNKMGINGRLKMEKEFDRKFVINAYVREIKNIH